MGQLLQLPKCNASALADLREQLQCIEDLVELLHRMRQETLQKLEAAKRGVRHAAP